MSNAEKFKQMSRGLDPAQAIAEADRCLLCHDAPCSEACPADTKPAEFIRKLRFKNVSGAIRTIKENNILGGACGVLCPTSRLCEEKCSAMFKSQNRPEGADQPIRIGAIQRFLIEQSWDRDLKIFEKPIARPEKVAVLGSGPGGLSCAAELAKDGYQVTVLEAKPEPGGVLRYGVVSYRLDLNFLEHEMDDIKSLGVRFQCNSAVSGKQGAERLRLAAADALALPFGDHTVDAVTVGFGVRNFADVHAGIAQIARVLRPGGQLLVLDFFRDDPTAAGEARGVARPLRGVLRTAVPALGRLVGRDGAAYTYLPGSMDEFLTPGEFAGLLGEHGFGEVFVERQTFGIAHLVGGRLP